MTDTDALSTPVTLDTTVDQRMVGVRAAGRRLQRQGGRPWRGFFATLALWMVVGAMIGFFGAQMEALPGGQWFPLAVIVLVVMMLVQRAQRRLARRVAAHQPDRFQIALADDALVIAHDEAVSRVQWRSIDALERIGDLLLIHLRSFEVLIVPLAGLAPDADAWLARLESLSGRPVTVGGLPPVPDAAEPTQPWRDLASNLAAGVGLLLVRAKATARLKVSAAQLVWLLLADLLLTAFGSWLMVGTDSEFNRYGMASAVFWMPLILFTAWASARAAADDHKTLPGAVALVAIGIVGTVIQYGMMLGLPRLGDDYAEVSVYLYWSFFAWWVIASIVALARAQQLLPEQRMGAVLAVLGLLIAPQWLFKDDSSLWLPRYDETAAAAERDAAQARFAAVTQETILYTQPALLDDALAAIAPGRAGVPELFVLSVGGHGNQDVFLREVRAVDTLFRERFDAEGRSLVLVNNPATVHTLPMASVTALARSLKVFGQRMNADEDVLVVFLTSHGSEEHRFDLSLWPFRFDELTPEVLRRELDAAGIRYRALIVSACFSGGFVPSLAGPDTLVMTASRADRNSHGCSHSADWTFFGRALFNEALRETYAFDTAFEQARAAVAVREAAEGYEASEPQIALGEAVAPVLTAIVRRLQVENMGQRRMAGAAAPGRATR
ncbi:C13 family peptidase [Denitromonas sp.]|uniref:C13 family peptidase n=1 Tax=Denitromonas sp. TaxID=2734609 RepID=UPI003A8B8B2E